MPASVKRLVLQAAQGDLQPDCSADQPLAGPCQPTANPNLSIRYEVRKLLIALQEDVSQGATLRAKNGQIPSLDECMHAPGEKGPGGSE
eukprot:610248-Pelagomonas_calceolata.AAC.1